MVYPLEALLFVHALQKTRLINQEPGMVYFHLSKTCHYEIVRVKKKKKSNRKQHPFKIDENKCCENKLSNFRKVCLHIFSLTICHFSPQNMMYTEYFKIYLALRFKRFIGASNSSKSLNEVNS